MGEDNRFSMSRANRNHNALGSYVHAPTIDQLESGKAPTTEAIIKKATEVLKECEQVLSSRIWNCNFGNFFWFNCVDCKTPMKGRTKHPTQRQELICRQCHAVHDVEFGEDQKVIIKPRQVSYICPPPCNTENWLGTHRLIEGATFVCVACDKKVGVEVIYRLVDVDNDATS